MPVKILKCRYHQQYFLKWKNLIFVMVITILYSTSYLLYFSYTSPSKANLYLYWLERKLKVRPSNYAYQGERMRADGLPQSFVLKDIRVMKNETCPEIFPEMKGKMDVNVRYVNMEEVNMKFSEIIKNGGSWSPTDCIPKWNVAFLIPFRNRHQHLPVLLRHLIPMLMTQHIKFTIYVINQAGSQRFNRAMLLNVGFTESMKRDNYDCVIFHDVDHLPENNRNYYGCTDMPRQFRVLLDIYEYSLEYPNFFGGVTGLTTKQVRDINGFSNEFWGWGGEDDDCYARVKDFGYNVSSPIPSIGRYTTISKDHHQESQNLGRFTLLTTTLKRNFIDGLNSLQYGAPAIEMHPLFTNISVDLRPVKMLGLV